MNANTHKAAAEELVLEANRQAPYSLLTTSIRPAGIFGEGDTMTIKHLVNIYLDGRSNVQVGDNNNLFDFTYATNVAHAHILAARCLLLTHRSQTVPLDMERVDGEAFIITNDCPVYFWDFCRAVWSAAGHDTGKDGVWHLNTEVGLFLGFLSECFFGIIGKPPTFNRQRITYSTMTRYYNITKARTRLSYKPLVGLPEAIKRSVKWYLESNAEAAAAAEQKKAQ
ncbi:NAD-dependent epimerase/dehydratase family protein [Candidatus Bathyarchaeota archaeon]|nr:NAD-dependent epimerase/dehydratase family protein [Candidatus Bathyarchaeota archaeon]